MADWISNTATNTSFQANAQPVVDFWWTSVVSAGHSFSVDFEVAILSALVVFYAFRSYKKKVGEYRASTRLIVKFTELVEDVVDNKSLPEKFISYLAVHAPQVMDDGLARSLGVQYKKMIRNKIDKGVGYALAEHMRSLDIANRVLRLTRRNMPMCWASRLFVKKGKDQGLKLQEHGVRLNESDIRGLTNKDLELFSRVIGLFLVCISYKDNVNGYYIREFVDGELAFHGAATSREETIRNGLVKPIECIDAYENSKGSSASILALTHG